MTQKYRVFCLRTACVMRMFALNGQDVAVHFMTDSRWEPDTLFLVFEEDFRFTDDSCARPFVPSAIDRAQKLQRVELDFSNKEPLFIER